jgi:hypothetical protein
MMKALIFAVIAVTSGSLIGCTYSSGAAYETSGRAQTNPQSIQVIERQDIKRPFKVIGMVTAESYYPQSAIKAMRKEAAKMGADAITDFGQSGNQTAIGTGGISGPVLTGVGGSYNTGWSGKAIIWQ